MHVLVQEQQQVEQSNKKLTVTGPGGGPVHIEWDVMRPNRVGNLQVRNLRSQNRDADSH